MMRAETKNSWKAIYYLRGLAIITVLINHYLNRYISGNQGGYANGVIAIFYILSGFGIYHSFERRFIDNNYNLKKIMNFYIKRFLRIYPLYLLSLLIDVFVFKMSYSIYYFLTIESPLSFINLLVQCYIVSFFFYYFLKKLRIKKFLIVVSILFLLLNMIYYFIINFYIISGIFIYISCLIVYRELVFSHIFLFAIGITIPLIIENTSDVFFLNKWRGYLLLFSFSLFLIFLYLTRTLISPEIDLINRFIFIFSTPFLIYFFLFKEIKKPLKKVFLQLGTYSYSIFLFHIDYYWTLYYLGLIQKNSIIGVIFTIILFPLFLGFCILIETIMNKILNRVGLEKPDEDLGISISKNTEISKY